MSNAFVRYQPLILSLLRIIVALLFLEHGLMKLFNFPLPEPGISYPLTAQLVAAAMIETVGGSFLAAGFFTRSIAFLASGEMAIGYFSVHAPQSFWPAANEGDAAILFCFVFLYLVFAGPGSISVDALRNPAAQVTG